MSPFTVAGAQDRHWGRAAKACLDALGGSGATVGLLYATPAFGPDLGSILAFLRETTRIPDWAGAVVPGLGGPDAEESEGGGLAVLAGALPSDQVRAFAGQPDTGANAGGLGLVHADPRAPELDEAIDALAARTPHLAGVVASGDSGPVLLAGKMTNAGIGGLLLDARLGAISGTAAGCVPIGPPHILSEGRNGVVMSLDDRPALDVLREEAGELLSRDLRRINGYLHVGLARPETAESWTVATLRAIDPQHGWLAVEARPMVGERVRFVRRDAGAARAALDAMIDGLVAQLAGRPVRAAILFADRDRDRLLLGGAGAESARVRDRLGAVPLITVLGNGIIAQGRRQPLASTLVLLPGGGAA
jgi:hypothetical protein